MSSEECFAATTPGLEPALLEEVRALGWDALAEPGGVTLRGGAGLHLEANLRLRCANRVLLRVGEVDAADLPGGLRKLDLARFWNGRGPIAVSASVHQSRLRADQVEAALLEAISAQRGEGGPELFVRCAGARCTVSVDTSGELLYRRGYRQEVSRAPLRETIAASLLRLAGYDGTVPLWDPMCGSGTLLIEGALIARNRAPGLARGFAFEKFPSFDAAAFAQLKTRLASEERAVPAPIVGGDLNAGSLGTARRNARRAGVLESISLEREDATSPERPVPATPGVLISNLPYGIRVGERAELESLYRAFGRTLRERFHGWRVALLVAQGPLMSALDLPIEKRHMIDNGGIRCELLLSTAL
jgi:putative N6-adenine-specific DNA methylase